MSTLTDEIKEFIVKGLACFDSPSQVAEAVKANFGIEISRQHVYAYDPNSSQQMSPRWSALHAAAREKFLSEIAEIGIAQKAVRLRMLDRYAQRAEARGTLLHAAVFLEQAAKECGGIYESRRTPVPATAAAPNGSPTEKMQ